MKKTFSLHFLLFYILSLCLSFKFVLTLPKSINRPLVLSKEDFKNWNAALIDPENDMLPIVRMHHQFSSYIFNTSVLNHLSIAVLTSIACDPRTSLAYLSFCRTQLFEAITIPDEVWLVLQFSKLGDEMIEHTNLYGDKLVSSYIDKAWMNQKLPIVSRFMQEKTGILNRYWSTRGSSERRPSFSLESYFTDLDRKENAILWDDLKSANSTNIYSDIIVLSNAIQHVSSMVLRVLDERIIPSSVYHFSKMNLIYLVPRQMELDHVFKLFNSYLDAMEGLQSIYNRLYEVERVAFGRRLKNLKNSFKQSCESVADSSIVRPRSGSISSQIDRFGVISPLTSSSVPPAPMSTRTGSGIRGAYGSHSFGSYGSSTTGSLLEDYGCKRSNHIILNVMNSHFFAALLMDAHGEKSLTDFLNVLETYETRFNDFPRAFYAFPSIHESIDKVGFPLYKLYLLVKRLVPDDWGYGRNVCFKKKTFISFDGFSTSLPRTVHRNLVQLLPRLEDLVSKILLTHHEGRQEFSVILTSKINRIWCFGMETVLLELAEALMIPYKPAFPSIVTTSSSSPRIIPQIPSNNMFDLLSPLDTEPEPFAFDHLLNDEPSGEYSSSSFDSKSNQASSSFNGRTGRSSRLHRSASVSSFDFTAQGKHQNNFEHFIDILHTLCLELLLTDKTTCNELAPLKFMDLSQVIESKNNVNLIDSILKKLLGEGLKLACEIKETHPSLIHDSNIPESEFIFSHDDPEITMVHSNTNRIRNLIRRII